MAAARSSQKVGEPCWSATTRRFVAEFDLALDGADKVVAAEAVEPGRADDQVVVCGSRRHLAKKLGAAVGIAPWCIGLTVTPKQIIAQPLCTTRTPQTEIKC